MRRPAIRIEYRGKIPHSPRVWVDDVEWPVVRAAVEAKAGSAVEVKLSFFPSLLDLRHVDHDDVGGDSNSITD